MSAINTLANNVVSEITKDDDEQEINPALIAILIQLIEDFVIPWLTDRCNQGAEQIHNTAASIKTASTLAEKRKARLQRRQLTIKMRREAGRNAWREMRKEATVDELISQAAADKTLVEQCCLEAVGTTQAQGSVADRFPST